MTRRQLCSAGVTLAAVGIGGCLGGSTGGSPGDREDGWAWDGTLAVDSVVQHHDPSCGCCAEYVTYLEDHGIDVQVEETDDLGAVKADLGVPADAASCHTLEVGDYLVEGHVPLEAIDELLADEPAVDGIAVPEMPRHSPGMGPREDDPLQVYAFTTDGETDEYVAV